MATESAFSACRAPIGHLAASAAAARSESVRQRIAARRRRRAHKTASLATRWQGWKLPDAPFARGDRYTNRPLLGSDSSVDRLSSTAKPNHHSEDIMQVARVNAGRAGAGGRARPGGRCSGEVIFLKP